MHFTDLKICWQTWWCVAGLTFLAAVGCGDDTNGSPADIEGDVSGECSDEADNDRDGLFDCNDPDCYGSRVCSDSDYTPDSNSGQDTATGSGQDTATGGGRDTATGNGQDTATGSGRDTATGSGQDTATGSGQDTATGSGQDTATGTSDMNGTDNAAEVAKKLGRPAQFLFGLGNVSYSQSWSDSPIFQLPVVLDFHYEYLVGLPGEGGWTEWNENGAYPIYIAEADIDNGVIPMVTVYQMAAWGDGNTDVVNDPEYMTGYWEAAKILMERYGGDINGHPAVVQIEPDFWGYVYFESNGDPSSMPAILHPECSHLSDDVTGIGKCWVYLARTYAPNVIIGLHATDWGIDAADMANMLLACGGDEADVVFREFLDRDAGCFEAGELSQCQRDGDFYLDETNQTSPNFSEHLAWTKTLSTVMGKPVMWWQVPLGVPSDTPGGTPGHYRDNRVKYIFEHVDEFVDAGGLGVCFGTGADGQTTIETDGGQFEAAVTQYYANPTPLP